MTLLRRCVSELYGLFVDDGANAALVVGWIAIACLMLRQLPGGSWSGPVLFAGLAVTFTIGMLDRSGR